MDERLQMALVIGGLLCVLWVSRKVTMWRIKRTYLMIMSDLERKGAVDAETAVVLPYAKESILRVGMKDYRPRALEYLVSNNIVGITSEGKYYLKHTKGLRRVF